MIISASRRCDLPAFSMEWLAQRMRAGTISAANPFNPRQVRIIPLSPDAVDGIVFWSKNPAPLPEYKTELAPYPIYVQYTLNFYESDIEPGLPPIADRLDTARALVNTFGPLTLCPRYDPILLSERYDIEYHIGMFTRLCTELHGYADEVTVSFLDLYRKIEKTMRLMGARTPDEQERIGLLRAFVSIAAPLGIAVKTCAEPGDYAALGVKRGNCIDAGRLSRIAGRNIDAAPDKNQRPHCGCAQSVDIGAYGRCAHGCVYCYARK